MKFRLLGGDARGAEMEIDSPAAFMIINNQHYDLTNRYEGEFRIYLFNEMRQGGVITSSTVIDTNATQGRITNDPPIKSRRSRK